MNLKVRASLVVVGVACSLALATSAQQRAKPIVVAPTASVRPLGIPAADLDPAPSGVLRHSAGPAYSGVGRRLDRHRAGRGRRHERYRGD